MPETPTWKLRIVPALSSLFVRFCKRRGTSATADLIGYMTRSIRRHGTDEEKAELARALEEQNRPRPGPKRH